MSNLDRKQLDFQTMDFFLTSRQFPEWTIEVTAVNCNRVLFRHISLAHLTYFYWITTVNSFKVSVLVLFTLPPPQVMINCHYKLYYEITHLNAN